MKNMDREEYRSKTFTAAAIDKGAERLRGTAELTVEVDPDGKETGQDVIFTLVHSEGIETVVLPLPKVVELTTLGLMKVAEIAEREDRPFYIEQMFGVAGEDSGAKLLRFRYYHTVEDPLLAMVFFLDAEEIPQGKGWPPSAEEMRGGVLFTSEETLEFLEWMDTNVSAVIHERMRSGWAPAPLPDLHLVEMETRIRFLDEKEKGK